MEQSHCGISAPHILERKLKYSEGKCSLSTFHKGMSLLIYKMHGTHELRSEFLHRVTFIGHNLIPKKPELWASCFIALLLQLCCKDVYFQQHEWSVLSLLSPSQLLPVPKWLWKAQDKSTHSCWSCLPVIKLYWCSKDQCFLICVLANFKW